MEKMNLDTDVTLLTKVDSKWITDINVKLETIKPLEDNIGDSFTALGWAKLSHIGHKMINLILSNQKLLCNKNTITEKYRAVKTTQRKGKKCKSY